MSTRGFTLIELIIVISIITIVTVVSIPGASIFQTGATLRADRQAIVQQLRDAQVKAQTGLYDSNYGVYLTSTQYIEYQGQDYASRDIAKDQVFDISSGVRISGLSDVTFEKVTGIPSITGTITVTHQASGETERISINAEGLIQ